MTETYVEEREDGTKIHVPGTRWHNPTNRTVTMDLTDPDPEYLGEKFDPKSGNKAPKYQAARTLLVRIPPQGEVVLPSTHDHAIHQTMCHEPRCEAKNRLYCRDPGHAVMVMGGLGPQLLMLGREGRKSELHPMYVEQTLGVAYTNAGPQRTALRPSDADGDSRLMAKARAARAGGAK